MSNLRSIVLTSLITGVVASGVTYFMVQKTLNDAMREGKENQDADDQSVSSDVVVNNDNDSPSLASPTDDLDLPSNLPHPSIPTSIDLHSTPQGYRVLTKSSITITYATTTGTCKSLAHRLASKLPTRPDGTSPINVLPVPSLDWWDQILNGSSTPTTTKYDTPILIMILPTWSDGTSSYESTSLTSGVDDIANDWRVDPNHLKYKLKYAIYGVGSSAYDEETFCKPAKVLNKQMRKLGAQNVNGLGMGDVESGDIESEFDKWCVKLIPKLEYSLEHNHGIKWVSHPIEEVVKEEKDGCCGGGEEDEGCGCKEDKEEENIWNDEAYDDFEDLSSEGSAEESDYEEYEIEEDQGDKGGVADLEDMGKIMKEQGKEKNEEKKMEPKEMVTPKQNPVGRTWRWKTDDPYEIVASAVDLHVNMIKGTKGIPGVLPERWKEAHTVAHCALSLVGEPIMYPRINELLQELHRRHISTFLVTNGQHPEAIDTLVPVSQLYVSVDAPTPDSLEAIDRPLFKDAFERLKTSLKYLRGRGQRTVARLTIVKGWNSDEIDGYADLIALGQVSFVELKGVTFCGTSDASNLNMSNSPWHHEVEEFAEKLRKRLQVLTERGGRDPPPLYGLACAHKHSCSVLLARVDQFAKDNPVTGERKWWTWIDYEKYNKLALAEQHQGIKFGVEDYIAPLPDWGVFGASEEGFDPTDLRYHKKGKRPRYKRFDEEGIPTHDADDKPIAEGLRAELTAKMNTAVAKFQAANGEAESVMTESKKGERLIEDPRLMFRGLVVGR
ncbi:hypothetical protein TL16_g01609 [Triparma laevis f. inornata]|uniref:tRNA 4-demethylwyosine synthase (AdoMet-dependent) n=1 Tax=Triparma laevis f. inornata TaxID=1714386 RepID=A0A9W7DS12_9STRA|nr:hypothetical protein TL16_g01609 [Triparma laevis f. inornata]